MRHVLVSDILLVECSWEVHLTGPWIPLLSFPNFIFLCNLLYFEMVVGNWFCMGCVSEPVAVLKAHCVLSTVCLHLSFGDL